MPDWTLGKKELSEVLEGVISSSLSVREDGCVTPLDAADSVAEWLLKSAYDFGSQKKHAAAPQPAPYKGGTHE